MYLSNVGSWSSDKILQMKTLHCMSWWSSMLDIEFYRLYNGLRARGLMPCLCRDFAVIFAIFRKVCRVFCHFLPWFSTVPICGVCRHWYRVAIRDFAHHAPKLWQPLVTGVPCAVHLLIWYCGFLPDVNGRCLSFCNDTGTRLLTFYMILDVCRSVYRCHFTASRPIFSHADVDVFIKVLLICSLL